MKRMILFKLRDGGVCTLNDAGAFSYMGDGVSIAFVIYPEKAREFIDRYVEGGMRPMNASLLSYNPGDGSLVFTKDGLRVSGIVVHSELVNFNEEVF